MMHGRKLTLNILIIANNFESVCSYWQTPKLVLVLQSLHEFKRALKNHRSEFDNTLKMWNDVITKQAIIRYIDWIFAKTYLSGN